MILFVFLCLLYFVYEFIINIYRYSCELCVDCTQLFAVGGQTQQQQIDSLLDEISDEVKIDAQAAHTGPAPDITDRLKCDTSSGSLQTNCF